MSVASLEREILFYLRIQTKNPKITKNWIVEWSTSEVKPQAGEQVIKLDSLSIYVAYKKPEPKKAA